MFLDEWNRGIQFSRFLMRGYIALIIQKSGDKVSTLMTKSKGQENYGTVARGVVIRISTDYRLGESKNELFPVLLVDLLKSNYATSEKFAVYEKVLLKNFFLITCRLPVENYKWEIKIDIRFELFMILESTEYL